MPRNDRTGKKNSLQMLGRLGQSVWYDSIRRGIITSGELARLIAEDGVVGVTSNPTIFEKAISGSTDYDAALTTLAAKGVDPDPIYEALVLEDIGLAADLLRPVYDRTERRDGYVSVEVPPLLARDTAGTVSEARRLFQALGRENVMIKVPATAHGIPAIEALIGEGINVNVTLVFSVENYVQVAAAFLRGVESLASKGRPIDGVASVASFFVSRVDSAVDRLLAERARTARTAEERKLCESLMGQVAIANAKLAFAKFQSIFAGTRFESLESKGAMVQRPLWASTGTKNPYYSDVLYVEELIGPDTVSTMPPATLAAFRNHGEAEVTVSTGLAEARAAIASLEGLGIDLAAVCRDLQEEGLAAFEESFQKLHAVIHEKRDRLVGGRPDREEICPGGLGAPANARLTELEKTGFARRLSERDATLWSKDPAVQALVENRLGWMTILEPMMESAREMRAFAEEIRRDGFTEVVLLGMGGSSLCPEVFAQVFGTSPGQRDGVLAGFPRLSVVDTTDPAAIREADARLDLARTLFVLSSKSGTTIEVTALYRHFSERVRQARGERAASHFVAITDPGTPLDRLARDRGFRHTFLNPPDIGGRYSALSYFGLVPAALIGMDVPKLVDRAMVVREAASACVPARENPGVHPAVILAEAQARGRDKVTFLCSPELLPFGAWVEQLLAESTGKDGKGLVPITGEPAGDPGIYGQDRIFVVLRLEGSDDADLERKSAALEAAGHPILRYTLPDRYDLGAEIFRWELITAVVGALLGINPFDEPNVKESKDNTSAILKQYIESGHFPDEPEALAFPSESPEKAAARLGDLLEGPKEGSYVALLAFLPRTEATDGALQAMRPVLQERLHLATSAGFGPRYLHSTGQLYKGGPNTGVFLQILGDSGEDLPIPGARYTFRTLERAQALGDHRALVAKRRRVLRIHLAGDPVAGLSGLLAAIRTALA